MKGNHKYSTGQLLNFARDSYFERTSRPVYAMVFLLPFIVFYELGTIFINTDVLSQSQVRVVAFVWLQNFLEYLGFGSRLAWMMPPLTVVIILAALQVASRKRWSFGVGDMWPMAVECVLLAVPLIVLSLFLNTSVLPDADVGWFENDLAHGLDRAAFLSASVEGGPAAAGSGSLLANIVTGIGAGIYEELVFRLILICLLMMLFQDVLRLSRRNSIILAVVISAALFSVHHHIVYLDGRFAQSGPFNWMEFSFRAVAGVYFAVLFSIRGFGVTAGTHAFYDIIATVINSVFFQ